MDDLSALVKAILRSPRIRGKLVVLCEGDRLPVGNGGAPSPGMYRQLEKMPDSSFYKACVPAHWQNYRLPQFFNCGGRSDVLRTYEALLAAHHEDPQASYLAPEKLYALVDLDLQAGQMPAGYPAAWRTTEDVHATLYEDGALKAMPDDGHRIWVTSLIHKEAFFVLPGAAASWAGGVTPYFEGSPLELRALHAAAAQRLAEDADLALHLDVARARLGRFTAGPRLTCADGEDLARSWLAAVARATGDDDYEGLVRALLAVAKAKPLWSKIVPDPRIDGMLPAESFRDQLALKVARLVAALPPEAHPLAGFFAWLKLRRG